MGHTTESKLLCGKKLGQCVAVSVSKYAQEIGTRSTDGCSDRDGETPFDESERRKDDGASGGVLGTTGHVPRATAGTLARITPVRAVGHANGRARIKLGRPIAAKGGYLPLRLSVLTAKRSTGQRGKTLCLKSSEFGNF